MAFCSACGADLGGEVAFCPKCGKSTAADAATAGTAPQSATDAVAGLQENIAGMLAYALGWLTGLIFFLIDKRPSVRFHAAQSMVLFGAIFVFDWLFVWSHLFGSLLGWALMGMLGSLISLITLICWVLCMVKAYQGVRFKLPVVGDIAENLAK